LIISIDSFIVEIAMLSCAILDHPKK